MSLALMIIAIISIEVYTFCTHGASADRFKVGSRW